MAHAHSNFARPIVLVHGAWHGAWCWSALQVELDRRGVPSYAIDLPGHGSSLEPFTGLHGDAKHVQATLDALSRQASLREGRAPHASDPTAGVVLVGHSYGGAVITQAALDGAGRARKDIDHLVYVAAFALDADESVLTAMRTLGGGKDASRGKTGDSAADDPINLLAEAVQPQPDGSTIIEPSLAGEVFYGECPPTATAAAIRRLCPQPAATMTEAPEGSPRETTPSTYVRCLRDRTVDAALQSVMAARCRDAIELDTDHSPFTSQPAALAEILTRIACSD